jgi:hypothetical protein
MLLAQGFGGEIFGAFDDLHGAGAAQAVAEAVGKSVNALI